jgi:hypothetical protein
LRRLVTSALLLAGLIGGDFPIAPAVRAAPTSVEVAGGDDRGAHALSRRANESGVIGDVRTVISAEVHRCHKDCKHDFF